MAIPWEMKPTVLFYASPGGMVRAMNVVKITYADHHLYTSFPAKRRCTVNSYNVSKTTTNTTNYTDSFQTCQPLISIKSLFISLPNLFILFSFTHSVGQSLQPEDPGPYVKKVAPHSHVRPILPGI